MTTTPENLVSITSTSQFQELLSKDLNRVSLINFWVPWAEQCTTMNEIVLELAKKYPTVLVLQVEAEALSDIAESFDIEAVPSFIILRGHTLLDRINGADATALTGALTKHVGAHNTEDALQNRLNALVNQSKVVLFMKGSPDTPRCGFSRTMVGLLRDQKVDFTHFDILTDDSVRQGLKKLNDWPTYPQLIIKGEFVGGLDVTKEMINNGELKELLA
ncbi:glutaredoxin [Amanita rubescens]|nr:glutaredoxin [Amanita rubescens]